MGKGGLSHKGPVGSSLVTISSFFFFFLFLNPGEEQVWNKKGNKVLDTEINHKLSGGAQF